jgi:hypothetical protein
VLDLNLGLSPVFNTLRSFTPPPPLTHSQDSFSRKFRAWKPHLSSILDFALILLFHYEKVIPLDDKNGMLTALLGQYTPRAVLFIIAGDVHNGGSFGVDGAGKHITGPIYICLTFFLWRNSRIILHALHSSVGRGPFWGAFGRCQA